MCGYNQQILPAGVKLLVKVAVSLIMGIAIALVLPPSFTMAQRIMAGIFVGAACLWITEALPPFATAIGAIVACVFGLGAPQGAMSGGGAKGYLVFLEPLVDPVIFLFLGGCIMALAVEKNGLDRWMARWFLLPFAKTERTFLLGVVLVTGLFSMFMSNTATTLMMLTLIKPMLEATKENRPLASATVMAVAFAANIGGMGTIVGSPPNAIAVAMLERRSVQISFAEWMSLGVPLSLILLLGLWFIVSRSVRGSADGARRQLTALIQKAIAEDAKEGALWSRMWVGAVFLATVALWITESLHGW
ncbi:MAG: SLC13 family permease, partial [Methylacidiphilales bacterium]|nr:SLC13 family permease [Candidatus Methylacidiphilales bacterium]